LKRSILYIVFMLVTSLLFVSGPVFSQTIKASIDRNKILIGEQIHMRLEVENARLLNSWFNIPDSVNHIEVVEKSKIDTLEIDNLISYRQDVTLTSFDSGSWTFPPLSLRGVNQATKEFTVEVIPVDVSHLEDYHDIKTIEEVERTSAVWITILIAIVTLLSIIALVWIYRKRKKSGTPISLPRSNQSPLEWAIEELDKLEQEKLYDHGKVKQHYSRLIDITRTFFQVQALRSPMQLTIDEWMIDLQSLPINSEVKIAFLQLLRMAITVKFARYLPAVFDNMQSVQLAKDMVQATATWQQNQTYQPKTVA
jgi:hypothetical protein